MMAIIKSCCFGTKTLRSGSFASGIYSLTSHTVFVTIGAVNINLVIHNPVLFTLSLFLLVFSSLCVITSVVLLVGLCVDNRRMLIPWMFALSITTGLDLLLCCFVISQKETTFDVIIWFLFCTDISMCFLNVYCIICVYSQYQEYLEGRGGPDADRRRRSTNDFISLAPNLLCRQRNRLNNIQENSEVVSDTNECQLDIELSTSLTANRIIDQNEFNSVIELTFKNNNFNTKNSNLIKSQVHSKSYPIIEKNSNDTINYNNNNNEDNLSNRIVSQTMFYSSI